MLGIALGAFMEGFQGGVQMGKQIGDLRKARKLEAGIEAAETQGKADFQAKVDAGEADKGDWDSFYDQHVIPMISNEYKQAGDIEKAAAFDEFADSSAARKGGKLFASGLQKLQMGDVQSGLDDMMKAANISGYGPDGKMTAAELYDEGAGGVVGYRLSFKLPGGKEFTKNVAKDDLPNFFAATVNPKAAFELKLQSDAAKAKEDTEVDTYTRKKIVDKQLGVGDGAIGEKDYVKAIQDERKRIDQSIDPEYQDLDGDAKEALARETVDKRMGKTSAAPAEPMVVVDPETGEKVAAPTQATPKAAPAPAASAAPTQGIVSPDQIAGALQQAGIPPEQWPKELLGIQGQ